MTRLGVCGAIGLLVGTSACAHRVHAHSPAELAEAFAAAVERKDAAGAYRLMSDDFRARVPLAQFHTEASALTPHDLQRIRRFAGTAGRLEVRAPGEREAYAMSVKGNLWLLSSLPVDPFDQATAGHALRSFVRAVRARRYDVLMRLVPLEQHDAVTVDRLRDAWEGSQAKDAAALLGELELHLDDEPTVDEDQATLTYDAAGRLRVVRLVRQEGLWRLESIE